MLKQLNLSETAKAASLNRIAIIGGGLAGLALAVQLQEIGIDVHVFERDKSRYDRIESTFGISFRENGMNVLKTNVGLSFKGIARPNSSSFNVINKYGKTMAYLGESETETINIMDVDDDRIEDLEFNRGKLRDAMIDKLNKNIIHWDYQFKSYDIKNNIISFKNRNDLLTDFDLIIGCDGYKSSLRQYLFDKTPSLKHTGLISIQNAVITDINDIDKYLKDGSLMIMGNGCSFFMQRYSAELMDKSIAYYFTFKSKENDEFMNNLMINGNIKEFILNKMKDWNDTFKSVIINSNDKTWSYRNVASLNPLYISWNTNNKISIMGDAAHCMPPFQGGGGILALQDTKDFIDCFVEYLNGKQFNYENRKIFLKKFEGKMMKRAIKECIFVEGACKAFHDDQNHIKIPSGKYLGGQGSIFGLISLLFGTLQSELITTWNIYKYGKCVYFQDIINMETSTKWILQLLILTSVAALSLVLGYFVAF